MTASGSGKLLDRRRVELVDEGLPKLPHHSEGQGSRSTKHTSFFSVPVAEGMTRYELPICPRQAGTDGLLVDVLPACVYCLFDVCCNLDHK